MSKQKILSAPKILIQVSITSREAEFVSKTLRLSIANLRIEEYVNTHVLVIFQSEDTSKADACSLGLGEVEVIYTNTMSVSHARNLGIRYAIQNKYDGIIFHDASVIYPPEFLKLAPLAIAPEQNKAVRAYISWSIPPKATKEEKCNVPIQFKQNRAAALPNSYIFPYIFPVQKLKGIEFDRGIGPGKNTNPDCGEDVIFLLDYFEKTGIQHVITARDICVYHPPRPIDMSKHLKYARGQGTLYRLLLARKRLPLYGYTMFLLFCLNSLRLALLYGKKGRKICSERWRGFWQYKSSDGRMETRS